MREKMKCLGGCLLVMLSFVLVIGLLSSLAMMTVENAMEHAVAISGAAQLLYFAAVVLVLKLRKTRLREVCGMRAVPLQEYLHPVLAALCFSAASNIIQSVAPIPQSLLGGVSDAMAGSTLVILLSVFVIAPVVEETVFRGLILSRLLKNMTVPASVVISALLFALVHMMAGGLVTALHAFLGGLIFALAYAKTGSLLPAIVAHIFGNIGGYAPDLLRAVPVGVQYGLAAVLLVASVILCAAITRGIPGKENP